jgi:hypothetical protein
MQTFVFLERILYKEPDCFHNFLLLLHAILIQQVPYHYEGCALRNKVPKSTDWYVVTILFYTMQCNAITNFQYP